MPTPKPGPPPFEVPTTAPPARGDERLKLSDRLHQFAAMAISLRTELIQGGWDERGAEVMVMTWFEQDSTYKNQA